MDEQKDAGERDTQGENDGRNAELSARHAEYGGCREGGGGVPGRARVTARRVDEKALAGVGDERPRAPDNRFQNLADEVRESN